MKSHLVVINILFTFTTIVTSMNIIDSSDDGDIFRIPLVRMPSALEMLAEKGADYKLIEGLLRMGSRQLKGPVTNDTLPLFKHFDTQYFGIVNIGKPGRAFKMIFDTAWAHSWVVSIECPKISLPCALHNRYDHRTSSTYKADGTTFNISGEFVGFMSKDVFLVGQMNSTDQAFAEIYKLPWIHSFLVADGIVGLGLQGASPGYLPFFYNFFEQNRRKLKQAIFSIYINRDPTTEHGGSILFGGIDNKHKKGEFTTLDVISDSFWTFKMDKVKLIINSKTTVEFCKNGCTATADTSSNTIVGPPDDIKEINTRIGTEGRIFNRYLIPCVLEYKGPKVNFTMGNKNFQILARDYVQKLSYASVTLCLSAFQEADATSSTISEWRLGGAFFYQFYTAFDAINHKIMIAEAA